MGCDASGPVAPRPRAVPRPFQARLGPRVHCQHPSEVVFSPLSAYRRGWFPSSYTKLLGENEEEAASELTPR